MKALTDTRMVKYQISDLTAGLLCLSLSDAAASSEDDHAGLELCGPCWWQGWLEGLKVGARRLLHRPSALVGVRLLTLRWCLWLTHDCRDGPLVERLEGGIGHLLKIGKGSTGSRIRSGDRWLDWDCLSHASRTMMCVCWVLG